MKSIIEKIVKHMAEGTLRSKICEIFFRKIDRMLSDLTRYFIYKTAKVNPKKIVFFTFQGDYTCNPKYIAQKLLEESSECDIVWVTNNLKKYTQFPEKIRLVKLNSYEYLKEIYSAKVVIANSVELLKRTLYKKEGQIWVETCHGSLGIKRFGKENNNGKSWVKAAIKSGKIMDYCISNSAFEDYVYRDTYWANTTIVKWGHARNDIFFWKKEKIEELRNNILMKYDIPLSKKIVLYAPTFRDAHNFDCYDIDYSALIEILGKKFGGEWVVLTRFHQSVKKIGENILLEEKYVYNVTKHSDIQELLAIADIGITDYSSWIYDFMLSRKPGFIFATDRNLYETERGFYYPLESTPFPVAVSNEELIENIKNFNLQAYEKKVEDFLNEKGCIEDGQASDRIVQKIKEWIEV